MRIIIYASLFALLTSCHPQITKTTTVRDSLVIKEVHHRDTVRIKGDLITVTVKEIKHDTIIKERQGRAELDIIKRMVKPRLNANVILFKRL